MLIRDILVEDGLGRSREINEDEFRAFLPRLKLAFEKMMEPGDNKIYRGTPSSAAMAFVDPTEAERKSRNTTNEYTLLFSHILPSWQAWPKRSRSLICSESYDTSFSYARTGSPYVVFPLDNPIIAICPSYDFWDSFGLKPQDFNDHLNIFYNSIKEIFKNELTFPYQGEKETPAGLIKVIKLIDKLLVARPDQMKQAIDLFKSESYGDKMTFLDLFKTGDTLAKFNDFFDPAKNGFDKVQYSDFNSSGRKEVWLSAPCVLIKGSLFDELVGKYWVPSSWPNS